MMPAYIGGAEQMTSTFATEGAVDCFTCSDKSRSNELFALG